MAINVEMRSVFPVETQRTKSAAEEKTYVVEYLVGAAYGLDDLQMSELIWKVLPTRGIPVILVTLQKW